MLNDMIQNSTLHCSLYFDLLRISHGYYNLNYNSSECRHIHKKIAGKYQKWSGWTQKQNYSTDNQYA